jgi:hypothetical protein
MAHAICYGVVDIGTQPAFGKFPARRKVVILFEFPDHRIELPDKQNDGKMLNLPRALSIKETCTLASKGNLRPLLEGWRGRTFTEKELEGFDLKNVIGANALINVIHTKKEDKTYANIGSISPLMTGNKKRTQENPPLYFSFDDCPQGKEIVVPANCPDWIKGMILQSEEYILRMQNVGAPPQNHNENSQVQEDEDEVPF